MVMYSDAEKVWDLILMSFVLENAGEVLPDESECLALEAFQKGDPEYQPSISQGELFKELNL